jgi:pyruvate/2-oxoglutarate dehydrogenase complex dihydrolipoamide acyltransferase (E2) component
VSSSPTETTLVEVTMPQMGVSVSEGTVAEWKKRPGDWVERDESIVEISTDKVETEIPSPAAGRVKEILVEVGQTVPVETVLAVIDTGAKPGEAHQDESSVIGHQSSDEGAGMGGGGKPQPTNGDGVHHEEASNGHAPPISPVVRRIADEHDIDLSQVEGTGRRGRITKRDVVAFMEAKSNEPKPEPALHMESPYREEEPDDRGLMTDDSSRGEPLSLMRRSIGEHMRRSLDTAAHCTTIVEADMSRIEEARKRLKLSYLPFVARCVIEAIREYPKVNAWLEGDRMTVHQDVNLGIAVSLGEDGLIVPVVHKANELSHEGIGSRIKDLASRARDKQLKPDEVQGGTFTITNPGAFGALLATPIINQPQVAILDLEAVVKRPVVVDGDSIAIRPMTYLCMSWDHRALDGAYAAQFLSAVRRHIEGWPSSG